MNKAFIVKSLLIIPLGIIVLSLVISAVMPAMAESSISSPTVSSPTKFEVSKKLLRAKLANLDFFSADFTQEVVSEAGELLEQSSGKLATSKPNLANWHTLEPDELIIVSDGTDVWFYNPWIEQVSIYSLSAAITKTPILLLTSKDESLWQQYLVTQKRVNQQGDRFVISAKDPNSQIKSLTLIFSVKEASVQGSELSQFSFLDATGQVSHIKLSNFDAQKVPESSLFNFKIPEGVQLDDQRAN